MTELEKMVINTMIETGRANDGWKANITSIETSQGSDWANVIVLLTKPRCRKPCIAWELSVYMPKGQIFWEKSNFANL